MTNATQLHYHTFMKQSLSSAINHLRSKGYKITKARSAILEILLEDLKPHDASSIILDLLAKKVKVNKTTVYRELDFLIKEKLVRQVFLSGNKSHFEINQENCHHHIVCLECGDIADVTINEQKIISMIEKSTKFKVNEHEIEFSGLCDKCAPK